MNAALFGTIGAAFIAAASAIITGVISRGGAKNAQKATVEAAEAAKDAALVKIAFDGLNETIETLRTDLTRTRDELGHVRKKCNVLGRNENKMRDVIQRRMPEEFTNLNLEVVPNGYS